MHCAKRMMISEATTSFCIQRLLHIRYTVQDTVTIYLAITPLQAQRAEAEREDVLTSRMLLENKIKEMRRENASLSISFKISTLNRTVQEHNRLAVVRSLAEWRINFKKAFFEAELRIIANRSPSIVRPTFASPIKGFLQQEPKSTSPEKRDPSVASSSWESRPSMSPHRQLCEVLCS